MMNIKEEIENITSDSVDEIKNLAERLKRGRLSRGEVMVELELKNLIPDNEAIQDVAQTLRLLYLKENYSLFNEHFPMFLNSIYRWHWTKALEEKVEELKTRQSHEASTTAHCSQTNQESQSNDFS